MSYKINKPIIRWVGGKSKLLPEIMKRVPQQFDRYFEPFVGGAALLLNLQPKHAAVADLNPELINFYQQVCFDWKGLLQEVRKFSNTEADFYRVRAWDQQASFTNLNPQLRAARFLFLNKTCFNGLWRTNLQGYNNVPFCNRKNFVFIDSMFEDFAQKMQHVLFVCSDYKSLVNQAKQGDFVYFDPPYYLAFKQYVKTGFELEQHAELRDCCVDLDKKGVKFILSNSDNPTIRNLFSQFKVETVYANCLISSKSSSRGLKTELLVSNT